MEVRGKGREGFCSSGQSSGGRSVLFCLGSPTQGNTLLPPFVLYPTVISRTILTHKDMTENLKTPVVESSFRRPSGAKGANGSTRTLLEKMGGKTGPRRHARAVLHADEM